MPLVSYAPLNLCVHNLDTKRPQPVLWPQLARDMIEALTAPLPRWLSLGPYPFLCESSRSLLDELQAATPGQSSDSSLMQDRNFFQSLDTVLSAVVAMRAAHYSFQRGPNPRTPFFVGLVQSVLLAQSHDLILREYLDFVLPRYPYDEESSLYELLPRYSRATLTGFCSIKTRKWLEETDEATEDLDAMSLSTDHDDDSQSCGSRSLSPRFDSPVDPSPELHEEHSDDSDDTQTFHHGCDKHIFIDKDLQPDVACVFVMAEQRRIYHALASALYHRRAIGIHEPIIGLTFGEHSSYLHLVLAWLGKDTTHLDKTLPMVHFLHAPFEAGGMASNGVFDMRDPIAALYLARVLHSVPQNLPCITAQAIHESESSPMDIDMQLVLSWRADQILPGIETDRSSHKVISAWVESLRIYNLPAAGGESRSPDSMSQHTKAGSQGRSSGSGAGKASSKAQSNLPPVDENQAAHHVSEKFSDNVDRPIASRSKSTSSLTNFSMSKFAAIPSGPEQIDPTTHWCLHRAVMREVKHLPEMYKKLNETRRSHVEYYKTYDALVALSWPPNWKTINDLPPVDPELEWLRELLWKMYEARVRCPDGRLPIEELKDPALVQLMTDRFQDLLRVVRDALGMKQDAPDVKVPEATFRTGFDRLIRLFFDGAESENATTKRLSILESRISMPRNDLAEAVMRERKGGITAVRTVVTRPWGRDRNSPIVQHLQHLQEEVDMIADLPNHFPVKLMTDNAKAARDLLSRVVTSIPDSDDPDEILNRALWEPLTGTVDNLGLIQIKDFFAVDKPYSTKDINDFALFDIPEKKDNDFASEDKVIEKLQRLLHRMIRPSDSRDPFVSARHDYLVDLDDPPQQPTGSPTSSLPSVQPSGTAQPKGRTATNAHEEFLKLFRDFFLPILVAEYKKQKDQISIQGPNQVRSYLVAALKFLAACDICEFLVCSLYTEGTVGVVQAGWKERVRFPPKSDTAKVWVHRDPAKGGIHLLDRNCQAFDISNVLGAFNFAVFLAKLAHNHAPKLLEKFPPSKQLELLKKLREKDTDELQWKYADQMKESNFRTAKDAAIAADKRRREQET